MLPAALYCNAAFLQMDQVSSPQSISGPCFIYSYLARVILCSCGSCSLLLVS